MNKISFTKTVTITRAQIPAQLVDDLKKAEGLPPYNSPSNYVRGDGYFYASITEKYGETMVQAAMALVINPMKQSWARTVSNFEREFA